jgi:hypothetical protein
VFNVAHFAEIDNNNIVLRVLVVGNDQEHRGQEFLANDLNLGGTWVQTSYNGNIRKNFAGIGYTYDTVRDAFIPQKPFDSWLLDEDTCQWNAPTPYPTDDKTYVWDEEQLEWKEEIVNDN